MSRDNLQRVQTDDLLQLAVQLLSRADEVWSTVSGSIHTFQDWAGIGNGKDTYRGRLAGGVVPDHPRTEDHEEEDEPGLEEEAHRFRAVRRPERLRLDRLGDTGLLEEVEREWPRWFLLPRTLILHGHEWWAIYGRQVELCQEAVDAAPARAGLEFLLRPSPLLSLFRFTNATMVMVASRPALRFQAIPVAHEQILARIASCLTAVGADTYTVAPDLTIGTILAWDSFYAGSSF